MMKYLRLLRSKTVIGGLVAGIPTVVEGWRSRNFELIGAGVGVIVGAFGVRDAIAKSAVGDPGGSRPGEGA